MTTLTNPVAFPAGTRALLPMEAKRRRALEDRCVAALSLRGYDEVILPLIDFVEPYAAVIDERRGRQSYRFTDRDGALIALRSDFTPMTARLLAPLVGELSLPARIFYRGDVVRCETSRLGRANEFFQIGAEKIGDATVESDAEIIQLAVELVTACGIRPTVVYRDVSLVRTALEESPLTADERAYAMEAIRSKNLTLLESFGRVLDDSTLQFLRRLASGSMTLDDLADGAATAEAAGRLMRLEQLLAACGAEVRLMLDDVEAINSYYTSTRFDIFSGGNRTPLASGGRYDALYGSFGGDVPAVGFSASVDQIEAVMNGGGGR